MMAIKYPKTDTKEQMKTAIYCVAACAYSMSASARFDQEVKAINEAKWGGAA